MFKKYFFAIWVIFPSYFEYLKNWKFTKTIISYVSYLFFSISSFASYFENILIMDNGKLVILIMDEEREIEECVDE